MRRLMVCAPPHFIQPLELPGQEGQSTPDKPNALADLMAQAVLETESRGLSGDTSDAKKDDPSKTACVKIDRPKKLPPLPIDMAQPDEGSGETPTVRNEVPETTVKGSIMGGDVSSSEESSSEASGDSDIGDIAEPPLVVDQGVDDDEEELEVNEELARELTLSRAVESAREEK